MKNKILTLLLVVGLLISFTLPAFAAADGLSSKERTVRELMLVKNFSVKYASLGQKIDIPLIGTDLEEVEHREKTLDQDREYIEELVDKFTIDRINMRDNDYESFVSLVLANAKAFIAKELRITYGGSSKNQIGDIRNGNSMCYGINIFMQELLAKYNIPSRLVHFGYENKDGGFVVDAKIMDNETGKVKVDPIVGHCSLLVPSGKGATFVDATGIISNPGTREFMRSVRGNTEEETMAKAIANQAASFMYGERKPKNITSMILPWYVGNGRYVGKTVSYYTMKYSAIEPLIKDGVYFILD